jgi:hypothetical protein
MHHASPSHAHLLTWVSSTHAQVHKVGTNDYQYLKARASSLLGTTKKE